MSLAMDRLIRFPGQVVEGEEVERPSVRAPRGVGHDLLERLVRVTIRYHDLDQSAAENLHVAPVVGADGQDPHTRRVGRPEDEERAIGGRCLADQEVRHPCPLRICQVAATGTAWA